MTCASKVIFPLLFIKTNLKFQYRTREYFSETQGQDLSVSCSSQLALVVKNPPANVGDIRGVGSAPGLGRSHGGGHGNPLQYSCLENPTDRGARPATSMGSQRVGHD